MAWGGTSRFWGPGRDLRRCSGTEPLEFMDCKALCAKGYEGKAKPNCAGRGEVFSVKGCEKTKRCILPPLEETEAYDLSECQPPAGALVELTRFPNQKRGRLYEAPNGGGRRTAAAGRRLAACRFTELGAAGRLPELNSDFEFRSKLKLIPCAGKKPLHSHLFVGPFWGFFPASFVRPGLRRFLRFPFVFL